MYPKPKLIEITGTSTRNKGAELMLAAIGARLRERHPEAELAVDFSFGAYRCRARHGLLLKAEIARPGRSRLALGLMPRSFRAALGMVRDDEVDAVLDASGYAFGDPHPLARSQAFARQAEAWAARDRPVILLPQALGPFEQAGHRAAFRRISEAARVVFARDAESFAHAKGAAGPAADIRLAPDFTNLLEPPKSTEASAPSRVCIVPNQRMLDHAEDERAARQYVGWLQHAVRASAQAGLEPTLLPHGEDDEGLIRALQAALDPPLPVMRIDDPMEIKRFIGASGLLIGSRYHALVSALSQGVPAIATSWAHKYEALFDDYAMREFLLPVSAGPEALAGCVARVTGDGRAEVARRVREQGAALQQRARAMWAEVEGVLFA